MSIQHLVRGHLKDLADGFTVNRVLPAAAARSVGPFVFVDHFGPVQLPVGKGLDVRPHPHIGLATVTYLFEGEIVHRDSAGFLQPIRPGDVNWMTAGRGIVHSERTPPEERARGPRMHGMQIWVGLPAEQEEIAPSFVHYPAASLPRLEVSGASIHVIIGRAYGAQSPVATLSPTVYCALELTAGAQVPIEPEHAERALYVASGAIDIEGTRVEAGTLAVLEPGATVRCGALIDAKVMLLGGTPLGHRYMWWNFVSSRKERIEQAKDDWSAQRIGQVPGETEFIPLPVK